MLRITISDTLHKIRNCVHAEQHHATDTKMIPSATIRLLFLSITILSKGKLFVESNAVTHNGSNTSSIQTIFFGEPCWDISIERFISQGHNICREIKHKEEIRQRVAYEVTRCLTEDVFQFPFLPSLRNPEYCKNAPNTSLLHMCVKEMNTREYASFLKHYLDLFLACSQVTNNDLRNKEDRIKDLELNTYKRIAKHAKHAQTKLINSLLMNEHLVESRDSYLFFLRKILKRSHNNFTNVSFFSYRP